MGVWSRSTGRVAFTAVVCLSAWAMGAESRAQLLGGLSGQVADSSGGSIAGAAVEVVGPTHKTTVTDSHGGYRIAGLAPGSYTVLVTRKGFASYSRGDVVVAAGATAVCDAALDLAPFEEHVTVEDQKGLSLEAADSAGAIVLKERTWNPCPTIRMSWLTPCRRWPGQPPDPTAARSTSTDSRTGPCRRRPRFARSASTPAPSRQSSIGWVGVA